VGAERTEWPEKTYATDELSTNSQIVLKHSTEIILFVVKLDVSNKHHHLVLNILCVTSYVTSIRPYSTRAAKRDVGQISVNGVSTIFRVSLL